MDHAPHPASTDERPANRLAAELSPYLLQHARNPVDWHPWGEEAIGLARRLDRPLFVSIGYATCYWCHVMERESFEDPATAALLNRWFVPVKVDREERPDVDDVYMAACQAFTRMTEGRASGGWPLSVFVDPVSLRPFYVGTYYPPTDSFGRPSFGRLLERVHELWSERREDLLRQGERIADLVVEDLSAAMPPIDLDPELAVRAARGLLAYHDRSHGGFGGAPKFPQPAYLALLAGVLWEDEAVASCLRRTLDAMACGGIHDHLAGGFHRYAVDAAWVVPHFEKMLYDNALLAPLYAASAARTGDAWHAEVARRTCAWALDEMADGDGLFACALDAEVDAREGKSYLWLPEDVRQALADAGRSDLATMACAMYGLDRGRNFQDPHHPDEPARNVLVLGERPEEAARRLGVSPEAFDEARRTIDGLLLAERRRRRQPLRDDKILAAWNGLMIAGLAATGRLLGDAALVAAAERAAEAVDRRLRADDGSLRRVARGHRQGGPAFLEDVAALLRGRIELALAAADENAKDRHRRRALELFDEACVHFAAPQGGFFDVRAAGDPADRLFVRGRSSVDGALPSGNGLMLLNALDLWRATGERRCLDVLRRGLAAASGTIAEQPIQTAYSTLALWRTAREAPEALAGVAMDDGMVRVDVTAIEGDARRGRVAILVTLAPGLHVAAPDGNAVGDGALGVALRGPGRLRVAVPPGEPMAGAEHRVLRGVVRIEAAIEGAGPESDLAVTVQPCDERCCHRPRTVIRPLPWRT